MGIFSDKVRVGVLRGGPSHEYEASLITGASVLQNLPSEIYEPLDIFISRDGVWHSEGFEKPPEKVVKKVDVIFNALHGSYGEDGTVQNILDNLGVPYTGSGAMSSNLGMNKIASKKVYAMRGLRTPFAVSIDLKDLTREAIREAYDRVPSPFVVKPARSGSSFGVMVVHSLPELEEAALAAFEYSQRVLIEEFIDGPLVVGGVIEDWRGRDHYSLIPFSENNISLFDKQIISNMAEAAHKALGLKHYSSSDFIVHPKRGVFIIETDVLPTLHKKSFEESLKSVGAKLSDFLHHVIGLAINKKK